MPGVAARTPGGLTYTQMIDLIAGLGRRAKIAGFDLVEFYPPADIDGLSALTAGRILVNAIGSIVRQAPSSAGCIRGLAQEFAPLADDPEWEIGRPAFSAASPLAESRDHFRRHAAGRLCAPPMPKTGGEFSRCH
jgi:hypothetical protein